MGTTLVPQMSHVQTIDTSPPNATIAHLPAQAPEVHAVNFDVSPMPILFMAVTCETLMSRELRRRQCYAKLKYLSINTVMKKR